MKGQKTLFRFQKSKVASTEKNRKKWSNTLNCNRCNCNYYWYGPPPRWDGDATVTERTRCDRRKRSNSFEADAKGRIKGGLERQNKHQHQKRKKTKAQTGTSLDPMKLFFVQGGIYYSSEEKGQGPLLKSGKVMEVCSSLKTER